MSKARAAMAGSDAQANGYSNSDTSAQQARPAAATGLSFAGLGGRARARPALAVHRPAAAARREAISGFGEGSNGPPAAAPDKPVIAKLVRGITTMPLYDVLCVDELAIQLSPVMYCAQQLMPIYMRCEIAALHLHGSPDNIEYDLCMTCD